MPKKAEQPEPQIYEETVELTVKLKPEVQADTPGPTLIIGPGYVLVVGETPAPAEPAPAYIAAPPEPGPESAPVDDTPAEEPPEHVDQ